MGHIHFEHHSVVALHFAHHILFALVDKVIWLLGNGHCSDMFLHGKTITSQFSPQSESYSTCAQCVLRWAPEYHMDEHFQGQENTTPSKSCMHWLLQRHYKSNHVPYHIPHFRVGKSFSHAFSELTYTSKMISSFDLLSLWPFLKRHHQYTLIFLAQLLMCL